MKKLMVMLMGAAACVSSAFATLPNGTDFSAESPDLSLWTLKGDSAVVNEGWAEKQSTGVALPPFFSDGALGAKSLNVKTQTEPVLYTLASGDGVIPGTQGLFFDALTKFTVFDSGDTPDVGDGKIGVYLQAINDDAAMDATNVNVVVAAGKYENDDFVRQDYVCGTMDSLNLGWDETKWVRVTIKAIADITGGDNTPGFVVFFNGKAIGCKDAKGVTGLTAQATIWDNQGYLFPSIAQFSAVQGAAFKGQGNVDLVSFSQYNDGYAFAKDYEFFTVAKGANIDSVTVTYGTESQTITGDPVSFVFNDATSATLSNVTPATGYFYDGGFSLSGIAAGGVCTTPAAKTLAATVKIGDNDPVNCETIADAVDAINGITGTDPFTATLTLGANAGAISIGNEYADLTIVLAGKTITQGAADTAAVMTAGKLTIIGEGTVAGNGITDPTEEQSEDCAVFAMGDATLTGGIYDGAVSLAGENNTIGTATAFSIARNSTEDGDCSLTPPTGYKFVKDEATQSYWVLKLDTSVDFTVTPGANSKIAEVLVNGDDVTGSVPAKLEAGDIYKVTFEAENGYMIAAGAQTVFEGTAANAAITVTGPDAVLVVATVTDADGSAMGNYAALADAIAAATNGCTVTLQQDATLGKTSLSKSITLDLNSKTLTGAVGASDKYLISLNLGYALTVKDGSIVAKTDATQVAFSEIFHVYADLTVENVAIDATGLTGTGYFGEGTAAVFGIMNGNVQITGSTSVANVNKGYLLSVGNHAGAGKGYDSRNVTINTTGTLDGDFFFAGGKVNYVAGDITGAKFYYGAARADTDDTKVDATTVFAISDLTDFTLTTGVGEVPTAPADEAKYLVNGQLYATVAYAEAVGQDKIVLFTDYALAADKTFANAVAVIAPAKITLGEYKLTAPNGDLADAAFVIPTGKKVEKTNNTGSFTYALVDAAQPVVPGEPVVVTPDTADAKVEEMNAAKAKILVPPTGVTLEGDALPAYQALFVAAKNEAGTAVSFVLTTTGEETVEAAAEAAVETINLTDSTATTLMVAEPIAGFYYGLKEAGDLSALAIKDVKLAGKDTVSFDLSKEGNVKFWQIVVSPTEIKAAE